MIITDPTGYRAEVTAEMLDLLQFRALVSEARTAARAGRITEARDHYRSALALWRGPALAGVDRLVVQRAATGLEEERAQAHLECVEQDLALGGGAELISELTDLVHQYPYREKLHAALMLALYRDDRQAEALAAYQQVRTLLVTGLGQEPGPALRELHQRILTGDGSLLAGSAETSEAAEPVGSAAHQYLPRTIDDFTGRESDLGWLIEAARERDAYASPVLAVDGMPGVGKTTLAVRAAHLLRPDFPDGQLFVDLRGHSDSSPLDPSAALSALLGQLGVAAGQIPADLEERVARWQTALANRRVLLVLDNAADGAQVAPLLPASGGCLTLVTSRRRLLELDGAHPRQVGTLSPGDALAMLERIAGSRVSAEPASAAEVAQRCGYLPLALRLAATRLAHRPQWRVQDLADRHRQALDLAREAGLRQIECSAYRELGRTMYAVGDQAAARDLHQRSLKTCRRIGYRAGEARALDGLAECLRDTDPATARRHWRQALRLFQELDHPEWHQIERRLAELSRHPERPAAVGAADHILVGSGHGS